MPLSTNQAIQSMFGHMLPISCMCTALYAAGSLRNSLKTSKCIVTPIQNMSLSFGPRQPHNNDSFVSTHQSSFFSLLKYCTHGTCHRCTEESKPVTPEHTLHCSPSYGWRRCTFSSLNSYLLLQFRSLTTTTTQMNLRAVKYCCVTSDEMSHLMSLKSGQSLPLEQRERAADVMQKHKY